MRATFGILLPNFHRPSLDNAGKNSYYLERTFEANCRQTNQIVADIIRFFFSKMWMSVAQEHIPAATMNPVLIAKGPTSVTASLVFSGI